MVAYDAWKQATSPEHFEKLMRGNRKLSKLSVKQLCLLGLKLCRNLPYSPITWLFLLILGAISAIYGLIVDGWVQAMFRYRAQLLTWAGEDTRGAFIIWAIWCLTMSSIASACGYFLAPASDGSGIPRMRALFAGVYQNPSEVLGFKTFVAKSIGTVIASGSGLSVGRAGPYAHICSMVAYIMGRFSMFRRVQFGPENYNYIRAAVASGTTACFGAPLGGVLFSIEVTARYYEIKCLWEGVICSSVCIFFYNMVTTLKGEVLFEKTSFNRFDMNWDLVEYIALGAIIGLLSGFYCQCAMKLRVTQNKLFKFFKLDVGAKRRMIHVVTVCLSTSCITFPLHIMRMSDRKFINEVFRERPLIHPAWTQYTDVPQLTLAVYFILKFIVSIIPCGAPMSIGVFGPLFTMGAGIGRLYGEVLSIWYSPSQIPAAYAVVGAAAFASSATQTVSTSVIFFELTGQLSHMLPIMLSCIVAYFVSGIIAPSIYDILAEWADLNAVCYDVNEYMLNQKQAEDYMTEPVAIFTRDTTYAQALRVLSEQKKEDYFPICEDLESRMLLGAVRRYDLEIGIARFFAVNKPELPAGTSASVADKIVRLISETLQFDRARVAAVDDLSLLGIQATEEKSTANCPLIYGPPFTPFQFTSIPVESYPPQVAEDVNLTRVHQIAAMYLWTQVYVVKQGRLLGVINLSKQLNVARKEAKPLVFHIQ